MNQTEILGVKINLVDYQQTLELISQFLTDKFQHQIVTVNPEFVVAAQKDVEFRQILNTADLSLPDGVGLVWASKLSPNPLKQRVTGTDLIEKLILQAPREGWTFFLLGGRDGAAEKTKEEMIRKYPRLQIKGVFEGDGSASGDSETIEAVRKAGRVDLLLVAYGQVKQEKWIRRNLAQTEAKIAIGVGGAFDYLSGKSRRAPKILRQVGLEWLYRLAREPKRVSRQLALPKFVYLLVKDKFKTPKPK